MRRQKRSRSTSYRRFDLWIESHFDNTIIEHSHQQHYPDDNKKSQWKKVKKKEITMKEFQSDSSGKRRDFDIIFGIRIPCNMLISIGISFLFNDCTILTKWQFLFL